MEEEIKEEIIGESLIKLDLGGKTKDEVINELAVLLYENGILKSLENFKKEVYKRESLFTTGIGMGIAIPHGKCSAVLKAGIAFGKSVEGILWDSMDGEPVHLVFLLAVPESGISNQHLKILAMLSRKLLHDDFRETLIKLDDKKELLKNLQSIFE